MLTRQRNGSRSLMAGSTVGTCLHHLIYNKVMRRLLQLLSSFLYPLLPSLSKCKREEIWVVPLKHTHTLQKSSFKNNSTFAYCVNSHLLAFFIGLSLFLNYQHISLERHNLFAQQIWNIRLISHPGIIMITFLLLDYYRVLEIPVGIWQSFILIGLQI